MKSGIIVRLAGSGVGDMCVVGGEAAGETETAAEWSLEWTHGFIRWSGQQVK